MAQVNTYPPPPSQSAAYFDGPPPQQPNGVAGEQPDGQLSPPQPPPFQKPNINIQPLIESSTYQPNPLDSSPIVGFSDNASTTNTYNNNNDDLFDSSFERAQTSSSLSSSTRGINLRYQLFLDKISPHWKARWAFSLVALVVFLARVVISQGWYVICYALAIYYLNLLIGFISPRVDPSLSMGDEDDDVGPMLPTSASDEFKPFIRRVPEFKFWISGTKATLIALILTLFNIFDVPVFWPILLIYFIILFACTMRQQIKHMIRYSYVPWDSGKKKYAGGANDDVSPTNV